MEHLAMCTHLPWLTASSVLLAQGIELLPLLLQRLEQSGPIPSSPSKVQSLVSPEPAADIVGRTVQIDCTVESGNGQPLQFVLGILVLNLQQGAMSIGDVRGMGCTS